MERKASGALIGLSMILTAAVIVASVILLAMYGQVEVIKPGTPSLGIGPSITKATNWPLIIGLSIGVLYSFLFTGIAIQMNHTHDRIADIHNKLKADQPD
jgi:4-hydroxybenzoate polyprenyltransferase